MLFLKSNCNSYFNHIFIRCLSYVPKVSSISEVCTLENTGQVRIQGWITNVRKMKSLLFVDVNDGSCAKKLQVTMEKDKAPKGLNFGASICAVGSLQTNKNNQVEILAQDITVLGECNANSGYPFAVRTQYNPNHQREFIHLRPRTSSFSSMLRIRHKCHLLVNNILDEYGFFNINVPILTTNDCEGGGEVFTVKPDNKHLIEEIAGDILPESGYQKDDDQVFFDSKTYLTVSGQLHLEAAVRPLKKVYSLGPAFRAENSRSRLHLSEFYMLEAEMAFVNSIHDVTNMLETFLKSLIDNILNIYSEEIHQHFKLTNVASNQQLEILNKIINDKFQIITYNEAFNILDRKSDRFKTRPRNSESFSKEHELYLVEYNNKVPVFIVEWPATTKPFYMKSLPSSEKVDAMDLLCVNVGELCGGGIREDDYNRLKQKIDQANHGTKLDWYLELRKYGNVTTGGFGMGFERFLQLILGTQNIKDAIPFPRWPHNCKL